MGNPHVIVIPFPAQGHVLPNMELSRCLVERGFKITFVNTEFNHKRVLDALQMDNKEGKIRLASIPDGLAPEEDRNDIVKLADGMQRIMPGKLEEFIKQINESDDDDEITCVISEMRWALEVAEKMGIRRAAFWTVAAGLKALTFNIPKLIDAGIIDHDGTPMKKQMIQLSPNMPAMNTAHFIWLCVGDVTTQKIFFQSYLKVSQTYKSINWHICNSCYELEPAAFDLVPEILPIGPLLASSQLGNSAGHFWPEDSTCLNWLDQQPARSVIYVAFGSITIFDRTQFQELALGLELTGRPFLWVVRPGMITNESSDAYPDGFQTRISTCGKLVGWAPQQKVLSHPSIGCFLSHCGWNSTMEGLSDGVPFLCWPHFGDQFLNQTYICDVWKVGLGLNRDGNGIILKEEIVEKVKQLFGDEGIRLRARTLELKEIIRESVRDGGCSFKNFNKFVEEMK